MTGGNTWIKFQPNPVSAKTGDCAIRAVSAALGVDWDTAFDMIAHNAKQMGEIMESNAAWGSVLRQHGFKRAVIPNRCPDCYTANDFALDHPHGVYVLGFGNHTAACISGKIMDRWDSRMSIPQYFWYLEKE